MSKKIEPNAIKTIDPNASNKIEQIVIEQKEIRRSQTAYTPHLKTYLDNLPATSLTTPFWRNNDKKISILEMDKGQRVQFAQESVV